MTIEELIWDVREILKETEDDSDLEDLWILHKLDLWRSILIKQEFNDTQEVNPDWLVRMSSIDVEKTSAADDENIIYNSITLGKFSIPDVIKLPDDAGINRIAGGSAIVPFEPTGFEKMMLIARYSDPENDGFGYYSRIGNTIYLLPIIMQASAIIIPASPMNAPVNENGVTRAREMSDKYPLDDELAEKAILEFLSKDMGINMQMIADVVNDSADKLNIVRNVPQVQANTKR